MGKISIGPMPFANPSEPSWENKNDESSINSDFSMDNFCEVVVSFRCKFCTCVCDDKVSMKLHIIKAHSDNSSQFVSQADTLDTGNEDLNQSSAVVSSAASNEPEDINSGTDEMKQEVFFCSECSIIFSSAKLCCEHMTVVHNLIDFSTELIRENPLNSPPVVNKRKRVRSTQEKQPKNNGKNDGKKSKLSSNNEQLCKLCNTKFKSTVALQTHEKCHIFVADVSQTNNQAKKCKTWIKGYVCCYCDSDTTTDKFLTWGQCAFHLWKEHEVDCDLHTCSVCKFKTPTLAKLKDHERLHRSEANFKCNTCRKTFKQFKQLKTHEKYHKTNMTELPPPSDARWYTPKLCPICQRVLSDSKCLKKHISAVHNKMKPYSCNICGHASARKAELTLHMRQHTGEKPYKCEYPSCEFCTGDHNTLRKHKLRHGGVRPYKCPLCDYCVIQSHAYKKHVLATHPGKDLVFVCSSCPLVSVNEKAFEAHRKDHEEGRLPVDNHQNESNSSKTTNATKHTGVDETTTGSNESTTSNDGKSSAKFWLRDEDSVEVVDTGGITIPAIDSETSRGEASSHPQFGNNCSFKTIASNSLNKMSIQTCLSSETQNSATPFLSDTSTFSRIEKKQQQQKTDQEMLSTSLLSLPTALAPSESKKSLNSNSMAQSKNSKKKREVQTKATQEKKTKEKSKKKVPTGKPKKKKKGTDDNAPSLLQPMQKDLPNPQSSITQLSLDSNSISLSQPPSTSFGSSIDESRVNMVAEFLASNDTDNSFLDPILTMGLNDAIDLDIICNDGTLDRFFNGFS